MERHAREVICMRRAFVKALGTGSQLLPVLSVEQRLPLPPPKAQHHTTPHHLHPHNMEARLEGLMIDRVDINGILMALTAIPQVGLRERKRYMVRAIPGNIF